MFATEYTGFREAFLTFVLLASLPGLVSLVWSRWKRRGSVILCLLCLGSVFVGLVLVHDFRSNSGTWFYRILPFLPLVSGALGFLTLIQKRDDLP